MFGVFKLLVSVCLMFIFVLNSFDIYLLYPLKIQCTAKLLFVLVLFPNFLV